MRLKGGALCGMQVRLLVLCAAVAGSGGCAWGQACTLDRATGTTIDAQPFLRNALGSRWNVATDRIAFSQLDAGDVYHVYTMRADRSDRREVAAGKPGQMGAPYWHPSGRYLLFVAQKPEWTGRTVLGIPNYEALPGFGRHDDLWLAAVDGRGMWQLTHDPNTKDEGVLIPVFSPDGHKVAWSSRQPGGKYILQVAEFVEAPAPHLTGVRTYQPGGAAYYEPGSFTNDSRSLVYTSDQDTHSFWHSQIYRLDLASGRAERLTQGGDYNEHPSVVKTPTGDWVVYMKHEGRGPIPAARTAGNRLVCDAAGRERREAALRDECSATGESGEYRADAGGGDGGDEPGGDVDAGRRPGQPGEAERVREGGSIHLPVRVRTRRTGAISGWVRV